MHCLDGLHEAALGEAELLGAELGGGVLGGHLLQDGHLVRGGHDLAVELEGARVGVDVLGVEAGPLVELEGLDAHLGELFGVELLVPDQLHVLLVAAAARADAHHADPGRVVLEGVGVGLLEAPLVDDHHVLVAARVHLGLDAHLVHLGPVGVAHPRLEALDEHRAADLRVARHQDAGPRAVDAVDPGRRQGELAVLVLLGVLAHQPDVPVVVLGEEGDLGLLELAVCEVAVPDHHGVDAADLLGEVGDDEDDAVALLLARLVHRVAVPDQSGARGKGIPLVVDLRGVRELRGVELLPALPFGACLLFGACTCRDSDGCHDCHCCLYNAQHSTAPVCADERAGGTLRSWGAGASCVTPSRVSTKGMLRRLRFPGQRGVSRC
jgi:hypothetical protein